MGIAYERYEDVPWYRRSWANNLFVLFGLFGCLPTAIWACVNLLTGQVYMNAYDGHGRIKTWGIINKIWAVLFALFWTAVFVSAGYQAVTGQPGQQ